jgi:hypothetical protein
MNKTLCGHALIATVVCCLTSSAAVAADWAPELFREAETIDLRTIGSDEGEYWFPIWVVVIDDQVFVRLGSRAAERVRANQAGTQVALRVGEVQFNEVQAEQASDYEARVADAMAAKYWTDIFVRYFPHPMTLRLSVASEKPAARSGYAR